MHVSSSMVLIHALVVGMVFIGVITYPVLRQSRRWAQQPYWRQQPPGWVNKRMAVAFAFYIMTTVIVFCVIMPICQSITGENPFMWYLIVVNNA
jgi:hypothetical protein